jgi:hypothetical protein
MRPVHLCGVCQTPHENVKSKSGFVDVTSTSCFIVVAGTCLCGVAQAHTRWRPWEQQPVASTWLRFKLTTAAIVGVIVGVIFVCRREKFCDFCNCELPDWKNVLTPTLGNAAPAVMNVNFDNKTYSFHVAPGGSAGWAARCFCIVAGRRCMKEAKPTDLLLRHAPMPCPPSNQAASLECCFQLKV